MKTIHLLIVLAFFCLSCAENSLMIVDHDNVLGITTRDSESVFRDKVEDHLQTLGISYSSVDITNAYQALTGSNGCQCRDFNSKNAITCQCSLNFKLDEMHGVAECGTGSVCKTCDNGKGCNCKQAITIRLSTTDLKTAKEKLSSEMKVLP